MASALSTVINSIMMRVTIVAIIILIISFSRSLAADDSNKIASAIKINYETNFLEFDQDVQRHYAQRMYRITGNKKYIYPLYLDYFLRCYELRKDLLNIDSSDYIAQKSNKLLNEFNQKTRKGRYRFELFKQFPEKLYFLNILDNCKNLKDYGIENSLDLETYNQGIKILANYNFKELLLNEEVILKFAPQAVNYVEYLNLLNLMDIRIEFNKRYKNIFMNIDDSELSDKEYTDKIYGLTHLL